MRMICGDQDDFTAAIGSAPTKRIIRKLDLLADRFESSLVGKRRESLRSDRRFNDRLLTVDNFKRKARSIRRKTENLFKSNEIRLLDDIGEFQHAPAKQLRFLMADPVVRKRYHQNRCSGYEDRYYDLEPTLIGEQHYDYRLLHDGLYDKREDGTYEARLYPTLLRTGKDELDMEERYDALASNRRLRWWMEQEDEDPTSKFNVCL